MRTVVFASKKHIEWINCYHLFLEPFLKPELKFCEWKTDGDTIDQIIPSIYDCIEGEKEWRAVILVDDMKTRSNLNPFDVVEKGCFSVEEKKKLFDEAIKNPLTKLCTYFCSVPVDADAEHIAIEQNDQEVSNNGKPSVTRRIEQNEAMAFNDYKDVANYKNKLRTELLNKGMLNANLPKEVYCVALRTIVDECANNREKINLAWDTSTEVMYSDFGDRNMYYDRMRYFVCDILPEDHVNYKFNYLEFMYTLLIFAGNHVPNDAVQPNRLYCIESDCSEQKLRTLLEQYDQKLENTVHHILREQEEIEESIPGPMSDEMAEKTFHSKTIIPVLIDSNFNMEGYYTNSKAFGLAQDCPSDEWTVWGNMYHTSDNVMHRFMKQPRRSLEKATDELRRTNKGDALRALGLNHFQLDDVEEYSESEEDKMISVQTKDFYDIERYEEDMEKANAKVRDEIATHMTKKTTIMISIVAIVAFAVGFVPVLFHNENVITIPIPVLITLFSLGMLALTGFIALNVFRGHFRKIVEEYNDVMKGIRNDVDESMNKFSEFLSHACHVMKCNFVLNELRKKDNAFKQRIRVLRGHANQIRDKQTELRELFGEYVAGHPNVSTGEYYKYDYNKVTEYQYPIPFDEYAEKPIYFLEDGHTAIIPYDFISSIKLRMEELYER